MRITEDQFLETELQMGIGFHNPYFVDLCRETAKQVQGLGSTIMDYGAGTGVYASEYHKAGFTTYVYEKFASHRKYIAEKAPHITILPKPITTDIMSFIEVAEHMTDKQLASLFKTISPNYILFSSTSERTDNDIAWGHINIKEQDQWDAMFQSMGYFVVKLLQIPTSHSKIYKK